MFFMVSPAQPSQMYLRVHYALIQDLAYIKHLHTTCIARFLCDFWKVFIRRSHCLSEPEILINLAEICKRKGAYPVINYLALAEIWLLELTQNNLINPNWILNLSDPLLLVKSIILYKLYNDCLSKCQSCVLCAHMQTCCRHEFRRIAGHAFRATPVQNPYQHVRVRNIIVFLRYYYALYVSFTLLVVNSTYLLTF